MSLHARRRRRTECLGSEREKKTKKRKKVRRSSLSVFSFFPLFTSSPFCPTKKQSERKTFRLFSLSARHVVHPVLDAPGESSSGEPQLSSVLCRREGRGRGMRQVENGGGRERNRERSAAIVENSTSTSSRQEEKKKPSHNSHFPPLSATTTTKHTT